VAASLAEPGLDLHTARGVVETRAGRRIRLRRGALAAAAVVVVAVAATALLRREDPREVIADGGEESTTTAPATTAPPGTVVTVPVTAAPSSVVTTTTLRPALTLPPTTAAPTNVPLEASLSGPTTAAPGEPVTLDVTWNDPDFADPAGPRFVVVWGDPVVGSPVDSSTRAACDTPGAGSAGTRSFPFSFSRPGTYTVSVEVSGCDGQGLFAETRTLQTVVTVGDGAAVVAAVPPGRSPAGAVASIIRSGTSEELVTQNVADLGQVLLSDPARGAVVLRASSPLGADDEVQLRWPDGCARGGPTGDVADLRVAECYSPTTTTTSSTVPPASTTSSVP
jgi:hypothetical protein